MLCAKRRPRVPGAVLRSANSERREGWFSVRSDDPGSRFGVLSPPHIQTCAVGSDVPAESAAARLAGHRHRLLWLKADTSSGAEFTDAFLPRANCGTH